jgi:hypothetical protein
MQALELVEERHKKMRESLIVEHLEGHYEAHEMQFGVVYKWSPESVVIECECGARPTLTASKSICSGCGVDYALVARRELNGSQRTVDKVLHPWRYAGDRKGYGLPC